MPDLNIELSGGRVLRITEDFDDFGNINSFQLVNKAATIVADDVAISRPDGVDNSSFVVAVLERGDGGFDVHTRVFDFDPDDQTGRFAVESFTAAGVSQGPAVASGYFFLDDIITNDVQRFLPVALGDGTVAYSAGATFVLLDDDGSLNAFRTTAEQIEGPATIVLPDNVVATASYSESFPFLNGVWQPSQVFVDFYNTQPVGEAIVDAYPRLELASGLNNFTQELYTSANGAAVNSIDMVELADGSIGVVFAGHERDGFAFGDPRTENGIYFARINADGTLRDAASLLIDAQFVPLGFDISGDVFQPEIYALDDGKFAVLYQIDSAQNAGDDVGLNVFAADGSFVSMRTIDDKAARDIVVLGSGEVLLVNGTDVTLLDPIDVGDPVNGGGGDAAGEVISGDGGADVLTGGSGDDYVFGDGFQLRYALPEANQMFRLYQATFNRAPDEAGQKGWAQDLFTGERTLAEVRDIFVGSLEFRNKYNGFDDADFVKQMYINVLGRDFDAGEVSQAEIDGWTSRIDDTFTRADVVNGFAESGEHVNSTRAAANATAVDGNPAAWTDDIYRLYRATLDREPDAGGLLGWAEDIGGGRPFLDAINGFTNSREFSNTYGSLTNPDDFVKLLYNNVLDRDFDLGEVSQAEIDGWTDQLGPDFSRANIVNGFSQSGEFRNKTNADLRDWVRAQGIDDEIDGGGGTNVLAGGSMSDMFVFNQVDLATNTVVDLEVWDHLTFTGFGYATDDDVRAQMVQDTGSVVFADQGTTVTFVGFQMADISDEMIVI